MTGLRAAYRALAQKHHPDVNPSADAVRVMKLLNEAWTVLRDETRRAEHDAWIANQETEEFRSSAPDRQNFRQESTSESYNYTSPAQSWKFQTTKKNPSGAQHRTDAQSASVGSKPAEAGSDDDDNSTHPTALDQFNNWLAKADKKTYAFMAAAALIIFVWLNEKDPTNSPQSSSHPQTVGTSGVPRFAEVNRAPAPEAASQRKPSVPIKAPVFGGWGPEDELVAEPNSHKPSSDVPERISSRHPIERWSPNGKPWPARSSYLQGMPVRAGGGLSKFAIDNTNGGSNVYVKLCSPSQDRCDGLRHIFIVNGASFTMLEVAAGTYEIRYRDLQTGSVSKSKPMTLRQLEDDQGTKFSVLRLTLYRVSGGNTSFENLPEEKF